jgi:small subunit ribosomal protein S1
MPPEDHAGSASSGTVLEAATAASEQPIHNEIVEAQELSEVPETAQESAAVAEPSAAAGEGPAATADGAAEAVESDAASPESMETADLMTGMPEVSGIVPGRVSQGQVVKVTDAEVIVDIGLKSEGAIPRAEFLNEAGELTVQTGDLVDFLIEDYDEEQGTFTVSHRKAAEIRSWENLERASHDQSNVTGHVIERSKGGLTVSIGGVRAFLPASQADIRPLRNLDSLIGQDVELKIIKLNRARANAVVSRKAALEEELKRRKAELDAVLEEGTDLMGLVKNLTSYGAFVDLGGMDGLLHVTDLAWGRVGHPSEVVQVGQEVRVKVLKYDRENGRISLGMKQLLPDPWEQVVKTYHPGDRLRGRVVSLTDYGAFCEIEPGIEGLIHVSEMTWSRRLKHPSKFVKVGEIVDVSVLEVSSQQRRISLSLRESLGDPWSSIDERLAQGSIIEGRVRNITDYGAFVEIEDGVEGLIHISDLSWNRNVKHPSEVVKKGQKIRVQVLSIDAKQRRISLGLKQLEPDAWQTFFDETPVGAVLTGKVARLAQFGAFVELREGIEGLCHVSEMGEEHGRGGKDPLKPGMELPFKVIKVSREERKVGLSLKDLEEHSPVEEVAAAKHVPEPAAPVSTTMGEKMAQAIRAAAVASAARHAGHKAPRTAPAEAAPMASVAPRASSQAPPLTPQPEPALPISRVAVHASGEAPENGKVELTAGSAEAGPSSANAAAVNEGPPEVAVDAPPVETAPQAAAVPQESDAAEQAVRADAEG